MGSAEEVSGAGGVQHLQMFLGWMLQLTALPPVRTQVGEPAPLAPEAQITPWALARTRWGKARGAVTDH